MDLEGAKITHEAKVNAAGDEIAVKATGDWGVSEYVVKKSGCRTVTRTYFVIPLASAVIGSMAAARRAGTQAASIATTTSTPMAPAAVQGSVASTPTSEDLSSRATASAAGMPTITPPATSHNESRITMRATSPGAAPIAIRMPISLVRRVTA